MTSIHDAHAQLLAERDKLKEELERQIRFVREATDERDEARAEIGALNDSLGVLDTCQIKPLIDGLVAELSNEKGQHKITQEKRKEFEGYADRLRAELDELKKGQEELETEAIVQKARAEGHADRADKAEAELDIERERRGKEAQEIGKLFQSIGGFGVDEKDPVGTLIAFAAEWHRNWQESRTLRVEAANFLLNIAPAFGDGYSGKALEEKAKRLAKDLGEK